MTESMWRRMLRGIENTDEHGWRFAPHGWLVMRSSLDREFDGLTEQIIGAGFAVSYGLGHGFLEAVHRHALLEALRLSGPGSFPSVCS
jgi:hypothetical protein